MYRVVRSKACEIIEISSESDNVVSSDHNTHDQEEKRDVESIKKLHEKDTEKRKPDEKCDVITDDDNEKSDVPEDVGEKRDVITEEKDPENVMYQMRSERVMLVRNMMETLKRENLMRR